MYLCLYLIEAYVIPNKSDISDAGDSFGRSDSFNRKTKISLSYYKQKNKSIYYGKVTFPPQERFHNNQTK